MSSSLAQRALFLLRPRSATVSPILLSRCFCKPIQYAYASTSFIEYRQFSIASGSQKAKVMESNVFEGTTDRYNGITVNSKAEPSSSEEIQTKIDDSLKKWTADNKGCIWFKVYVQDASWVPILANKGFNFHHARDGFVMMYKWLPDNEANLPPASHTNLGVGGLVINEKNQVLAVSEKHYQYPHWKLPGGYVERGEDIVNAAIREVKEETGVEAEFQSIVALRHTHQMTFGNSDIYIVVMLKPTSEEIHISEREINKCQWMDVDEYLNHPNVHEFNRSIMRSALDYKRKGIKIEATKKTFTFATLSKDITMMSVVDL